MLEEFIGLYQMKTEEVARDVPIDESKYTQLVPEFENTYFKSVYNTLKKI